MIILKTMFAIVGLCGLLMIGFAAYFVSDTINMYRKGIRVKGIISWSQKSSSGFGNNKRTKYYARADFKTKEGKLTNAEAETFRLYEVNKEVYLYYLPEKPDKIMIPHWFGNWWLAVLLLIFGLFLCYLGFAQFFVKVK